MRFTTEHHRRLDDAAIAIDKGYPVDYNQGVWHMGLAMDDPDVASLVDDWGEIVALGESVQTYRSCDFAIETEWTLREAGVHSVTLTLPGGTEKRMSLARFREWLEEDAKQYAAICG